MKQTDNRGKKLCQTKPMSKKNNSNAISKMLLFNMKKLKLKLIEIYKKNQNTLFKRKAFKKKSKIKGTHGTFKILMLCVKWRINSEHFKSDRI